MILRIHREGYRMILISTVILIAAAILAMRLPVLPAAILVGIALVLYAWIISFFRNPVREITEKAGNTLYAPADGKVVAIEEKFEDEFLKCPCIQLSIFMSPLNVHVNRIPVSGKIIYTKYHPGKYLVAWHPKSSTENERCTSVIETPNGRILIRQIAGALARRIISYARTGMDVEQGGELGFIRFGSRVDVLLPVDSEILVRIDQAVQGNLTVIARLPES